MINNPIATSSTRKNKYPATKVGNLAKEISLRSEKNKSPQKTPYKNTLLVQESPKRAKRNLPVFSEFPPELSEEELKKYQTGSPSARKLKTKLY